MNRKHDSSGSAVALQVTVATILLTISVILCATSFNGAPSNPVDGNPDPVAQAPTPVPTPTPTPPPPGITLVSRYSDAQALAVYSGTSSPPPQIQTDFLPAHLINTARSTGFEGAEADSTSNSSIALDNTMGTMSITGDGRTEVYARGSGSSAHASAVLITLDFDIADFAYDYSLNGQLSTGYVCCSSHALCQSHVDHGNYDDI